MSKDLICFIHASFLINVVTTVSVNHLFSIPRNPEFQFQTNLKFAKDSIITLTENNYLYFKHLQTNELNTFDISRLINSSLRRNCSVSVEVEPLTSPSNSETSLTSVLSICYFNCQNNAQTSRSKCEITPAVFFTSNGSASRVLSKSSISIEGVSQIRTFSALSEDETIFIRIHGANQSQTGKTKGHIFDSIYKATKSSGQLSEVSEKLFETDLLDQTDIFNRQPWIRLRASQVIRDNDRSLAISIFTNEAFINSGKLPFAVLISDISGSQHESTNSKLLTGESYYSRHSAINCEPFSVISGQITQVSMPRWGILIGIHKNKAEGLFTLCHLGMDHLISKYDLCFQSADNCFVDANEIKNLGEFDRHSLEALVGFQDDSDHLENIIVAIRNTSSQSFNMHRFRLLSTPSEPNEDPSKVLHHLDEIAILSSQHEQSLVLQSHSTDIVFAVQTPDEVAVSRFSDANPICSDANNCFQCHSNVFGLGNKCSWKNRKCSKDANPSSQQSCAPKITGMDKKFVHKSTNEFIYLQGESLSPIGEITCHGLRNGEEILGNSQTYRVSNVYDNWNYDKIKFSINSKYFLQADALKCRSELQKHTIPQIDLTLEAKTLDFPFLIPLSDPVINEVYPETVPVTTGFLITIKGVALWDESSACDPSIELTNNDNQILDSVRYQSRSSDSVTFLLSKPSERGITSGEMSLSIRYDSGLQRKHKRPIKLEDPSNFSIIQGSTLLEGGVDIVINGTALESLQGPVIIIRIADSEKTSRPSNDFIFESEEQQCSLNQKNQTVYCKTPIIADAVEATEALVTLKSSQNITSLNCSSGDFCGFYEDLLANSEDNVIAFVDPPDINVIDKPNALEVKRAQDRLINITYSNLDTNWIRLGLVRVFIGSSGECTIKNFTNDTMICETPKNIPKQEAIYVLVGNNYRVKVGTFYYEKETSMFLLYVTTGCSVAFLSFFLFISVVVCLHQRRKKQALLPPTLGFIDARLSRMTMGSISDDPVSSIPDEEHELLLEFTDTEGIKKYASQRISPSLIFGIGEKPIGHGQFGEVYRAVLKYPQGIPTESNDDTLNVALKCVRKRGNYQQNKDIWRQLIQEGDSMTDFSHKNVLGMLGFSYIYPPNKSEPEFCIVLPFMNVGSLHSYLKQNGNRLPNEVLVDFAYQAARGMAYLHDQGILHQDLAARNCMLNINESTKEFNLKVSDFGLSTEVTSQQKASVLPIMWCAPELLRPPRHQISNSYQFDPAASDRSNCPRDRMQPVWSREADVWAYGVLVWEIFHEAKNPYQHLGRITTDNLKYSIAYNQETPQIGSHVELETVIEIMQLCWQQEASERPTFHEICSQLENLVKLALTSGELCSTSQLVSLTSGNQADPDDSVETDGLLDNVELDDMDNPTYSEATGFNSNLNCVQTSKV